MTPTVSVIITTHNRLSLVKRGVASVQKQTHTPLEIVIIDDCSQDETSSYFSQCNESQIRLITLDTPSGANVARNRGIVEAKGDYIAFLDDDDFWVDTKLEVQIRAMIEQDAPFSYTGLHNVTPKEKTIKRRFYPVPPSKKIFESLMANNFMGSTSSIVVKRDFILENRIWFDENLGSMQDYDFYLRCFTYTNRVAAVNQYLTMYHQERSLFTGKISAQYQKFMSARELLLTKYRGSEYYPLLKRSLDTVLIKKCVKYPLFFLGALNALFKRSASH